MYQSILVPLDGSPFGEHALPLALSVARRAGAVLKLLHVHAEVPMADPVGAVSFNEEVDRHLKRQAEAYLEGVVKRLRELSSVTVTCDLIEGTVAETIRRETAGTGSDLIVMTTHGRGPLGRFWLGSVADELVRQTPIPLLLVRPSEIGPDWKTEPVLKHVLVPLDGSALAEHILEAAVSLGRLMNADYRLLRVIKPITPANYAFAGANLPPLASSVLERVDAIHEQLRKEARSYLVQVAERLRSRSLRVSVQLDTAEQPGAAILHQASPPGIGMIALETHGRRGLPRLVLGSVANKVIRGATVPVLVQHPAYP
jgi:nucleotide-binding universal stress UspA family protein